MTTLTYCKGLPTPADEMNILGFTEFEMFLAAYSPIVHKAMCETISHLLTVANFDKSKWNSYLQATYKINKRSCNGIIADAKGRVESAKECRANHLKQLNGKLKSAISWLTSSEKFVKTWILAIKSNSYVKKVESTLECFRAGRTPNYSSNYNQFLLIVALN